VGRESEELAGVWSKGESVPGLPAAPGGGLRPWLVEATPGPCLHLFMALPRGVSVSKFPLSVRTPVLLDRATLLQ
jgi:hypothetical protein